MPSPPLLSVTSVNTLYSKKACLSVLHCNVRSIHKNGDVLLAFLSQHSFTYDIIGITETWLKSDDHFDIPGYVVGSLPRNAVHRGGGVALYIKSSILFNALPHLTCSTNDIEALFLELCYGVVVAVVYRPPDSSMSLFLNKMEDILTFISQSNKKSVICGDFNIDLCKTVPSDYLLLTQSFNFTNVITESTRVTPDSSTLIDHILCNQDAHDGAGVYETNIADHFPIFIFLPINAEETPHLSTPHLRYRINYELLHRKLSAFNFDLLFNSDINIEFGNFITVLKTAIADSSSELRKPHYSEPICPWMTRQILCALQEKNMWQQKLKRHKHNSYYLAQYKMHRNLSLSLIRTRKKEYHSKLISESHGDFKKTWNVINSVIKPRSQKQTTPVIVTDETADAFNSFFINIGDHLANNIVLMASQLRS
ncbi:uncharacterized protein LOC120837910 [Ixodes scapularis]|uniref:uncharacterized protein LOC120837910 n=1 Tax=Ixodes scapularis TaxID=6945 RepID=UPI001C37F60F|nr:uncharacterized protein LOC120837910 [Ixodes scapularis]